MERGIHLAEEAKEPFAWLTCTNAGASEVCKAALTLVGVTDNDLKDGYFCDPTTKSDLRIVARPGIVIRLSRNFDKQRGFVNGALAVVCESLRKNAVFTAKLVGTGNMVLVHPMTEGGERFLPCCYGYATTIRRAQGADLYHGCVYFDQQHHVAARGYAYVATSRFKTRSGCYLYGKLRMTDFLPAGDGREDEVLERGYSSDDTDDSEGGRGIEHAHQDDDFDDVEAVAAMEDEGTVMMDF